LHELPPTHLTCDVADEPDVSAARAALPMKTRATAVANIAPVTFAFDMIFVSFGFRRNYYSLMPVSKLEIACHRSITRSDY
jgi:hypothetical protein